MVVLGVGGWWLLPAPPVASAVSVADSADWAVVRRLSFDLTIIETGSLEASKKIEVKSRVDGKNAILELIDEGVVVEEGQQLIKLDDAKIRADLEEASLKLEDSLAKKVKAEQDLTISTSEAIAAEREATVELTLAQLEWSEWEQGEVPTQRRTLQLALEKAQRDVAQTTRNYDLDKELYGQNFISLDELEESEIAKIEAADDLATAKLDIEVYEKYTFEKERQTKQSAVDQAVAELDRVKAENASELEQLRAAVQSATRSWSIQQDRVRVLTEQLGFTMIVAPAPGLVVYSTSGGNRWRRGDPMAPGREVIAGETIIQLPDTRQLVAVLKVPEALVPQVVVGQDVSVTVDARPGVQYPGKVASVSVLAEDGGWLNPNLREFTVRVALELEADHGLKPTMSCTGTIRTGRIDNANAIPIQAVFAEGKQRYVHTPGPFGGLIKQPVTIGRASETLVEITEGLDENDRVLLRSARPGEVETKS